MCQIIRLTKTNAHIRLVNGMNRVVVVKRPTHVQGVLLFLQDPQDKKAVLDYYSKFYNLTAIQNSSPSSLRQYQVS